MTVPSPLRDRLARLWREAQDAVRSTNGAHVPVPAVIPTPAFFPGGLGLASEDGLTDSRSEERVMLIGQDFGTVEYAQKVLRSGTGEEKSPTWRALLSLLRTEHLDPSNCYFTNALLGLRPGATMTGAAPGWKDPRLLSASRASLLSQIRLVQPSAIFALGLPAARFLGSFSPVLAPWMTARTWTQLDGSHPVRHVVPEFSTEGRSVGVGALLHPSFRGPNLHRRHFRGRTGEAAEARIIAEVMNRPNGDGYTRVIASEQLRPQDIPAANASWAELNAFINTINGSEVAGDIDRLREWTEGDVPPESVDMARAMLYGHGRWMRWTECNWENWERKRSFFALLHYVREKVGTGARA